MINSPDKNNSALHTPNSALDSSALRTPHSALIRVLLVDDSPVALVVLKRMLSKSLDIEVVGTALDGNVALRLIPQLKPDVICTDLHMPGMDGLEFTKEVMATYPKPILLVSVSAEESSLSAFEVLKAGAVDLFMKPRASFERDYDRDAPQLIQKIKILAGVRVFKRPRTIPVDAGLPVARQLTSMIPLPKAPVRIIVIGASTGGPQALQTILTRLPGDFPLPIICVQHINEGFLQGLVDWLSTQCRMKVEIATTGVIPRPGTVYFPQEGTHLKIDDKGRLVISPEQPFEGHRPSVTVTMRSVAAYCGDAAFGVLLTGMGKDGAEGLNDIRKAGGITIAQDEKSSVVFGMPKVAIEMGAAGCVVPLDDIGPMMLDLVLRILEAR